MPCITQLLCSPVLVPQITGGEGPLGLLTLKLSVKHCPNAETAILSAPAFCEIGPPWLRLLATEAVLVDGPDMVNVSKSSLS